MDTFVVSLEAFNNVRIQGYENNESSTNFILRIQEYNVKREQEKVKCAIVVESVAFINIYSLRRLVENLWLLINIGRRLRPLQCFTRDNKFEGLRGAPISLRSAVLIISPFYHCLIKRRLRFCEI
jgi:hypothetical protein